ncbi:glycerophosphoryl diester phosphodiesterase membrane domain-containing protein [Curtobacterium sp. RRHDQ10]|uniref:glycerophosphoryl diester phosphodiesterase membrane domain-containing protein n=1 Tax=Curtobacterium phyllosphaerae TaxID=3413379 RepID=UPI003BF41468
MRVLLVYGLVLSGVATTISLLVSRGFTADSTARIDSADPSDVSTMLAGSYTLTLVVSVISAMIGIVGRGLLQAPVAAETGQQILGRRASVAGVMALLAGRRLRVLWWSLLLAAAIGVGGAVLVVVFAAIAAGMSGIGGFFAAFGALTGIGLAFGVLAAWLGTKFSLTVPGIALEGLGVVAAARNSWRLVRGAFWRTFGIELLVRVMFNVAVTIASIPLSLVVAFAGGTLDPLGAGSGSGTGSASGPVAIAVVVLGGALAVAVTAITDVIAAGTTTLLYVDRRFRTEGLDGRVASHLDIGVPADPFSTVDPDARRPHWSGPPSGAAGAWYGPGGSSGQQPTWGGQQPTWGGQQPTWGGQQPGPRTQPPVWGDPTRGPGEQSGPPGPPHGSGR